jgi:hypothetical protein
MLMQGYYKGNYRTPKYVRLGGEGEGKKKVS